MSSGGGSTELDRMRDLLVQARRLGDPNIRCRCLVGLEMAEGNAGHLEQADLYGSEAVRDAEALAPAEMVMAPAHICYTWVLEQHDRLDDAVELVRRLHRLAGALPRSSTATLHDGVTGRIHFQAGRWDAALVDLDSALASDDANTGLWTDGLAFRAAIAVHRGQTERAADDLARIDAALAAGGSCWALDHYLLARAFLLEAAGQVDKSAEVLARAWQLADSVPLAMMKSTIGPHLVRWSMALGDVDAARGTAEDVGRLAAANPRVPRLQSTARWRRGLADGDSDALLAAVELQRLGPRPLERALAAEDAAALLATGGALEPARELLNEALEGYGGLQASHRVAAVRSRLRALGVRTGVRGQRRRPMSGWGALTEAELRVVELVAEHLSNPEIAQRLFISRRTVETHVSHALGKLGFVSRRELVAEAHRRRTPGREPSAT